MVKSFSDKVWNFPEIDTQLLKEITDIVKSDLIARILINRGFNNKEEIDHFFNAKLINTIPEPSLFLDMDLAVDRVIIAIENHQNITIIGDYDVDGITSTALVVKYLRSIEIEPKYYIPNRFSDGYGISDNAIAIAQSNNADLVIVVDSGTNSISEIAKAKQNGIDVVVLDHHSQLSDKLPEAIAIVNPKRKDQKEIGFSYIKNLCAVGVVFMFLIALQRKLKEAGFFKNIKIPDLKNYADIVALGTICDVMELKGINRAVVKYFLSQNNCSLGIRSLMDIFNIQKISSPDDFAFFIGPAMNASGRIGDPHVALNLLLENDPQRSIKIATCLIEFNKKRKEFEKQMLAEALDLISEKNLNNNKGICVYNENWNEGIIGIVAGKLKDKVQKPIFVVALSSSGEGKGSARSNEGIHIGELLQNAIDAGIITKGGGHALAGGFSIQKDKLQDFQKFINENIKTNFINSINIDYTLSAMSNLDTIYNEVKQLEPFGEGIKKPLFCFKRLRILNMRKSKTGGNFLIDFSCEFGNGKLKSVIFHINTKQELLRNLNIYEDCLLDIIGTLNYSENFGSSIIIEDIRLSPKSIC